MYNELMKEMLKMFALEDYIKKMKEEQITIQEAKQEKRTFLEAGRKNQQSHIQAEQMKMQKQIEMQ